LSHLLLGVVELKPYRNLYLHVVIKYNFMNNQKKV